VNARVAAVQAQAQEFRTDQDFCNRVLELAKKATDQGAELLVFPEDLGLWLELAQGSPRLSQLLTSTKGYSSGPAPGASAPSAAEMLSWRGVLEGFHNWIAKHVQMPELGQWLAQSKISSVYREAFAQAAGHYKVPIVAGSIYEKRDDGIYNVCYVFDKDGGIAGSVEKSHLVSVEESIGVKAGHAPHIVRTRDYAIGACICYDLSFPDVPKQLAAEGAQIVCAGSTGYRPWPNYPYVPDHDAPQIARAKETGLVIVRAYQCGWIVPGVYMDGLSDIVLSDGTIAVSSFPNTRNHEWILAADVTLKQ
jgi:predicted amidohydrolase